MMTGLWRSWLTLWAVGVVVFGLVLYGAGYPQTDGATRAVFSLLGSPLPDSPDRYLRFSISLMGAVSIGWGLTGYVAFRAAWASEATVATKIWRGVTAAVIFWYIIDSTASCVNGFELNAVSNTLLLIAYLIPIAASGALKRD